MASTSVGTGQVIASTAIVQKVQSWNQAHGDNQQRNIATKQDEENDRKKTKVTESEKQEKATIRRDQKKEKDRRKAKEKQERKKKEEREEGSNMPIHPRRIDVVA